VFSDIYLLENVEDRLLSISADLNVRVMEVVQGELQIVSQMHLENLDFIIKGYISQKKVVTHFGYSQGKAVVCFENSHYVLMLNFQKIEDRFEIVDFDLA
jgi:hypothetical protein